MYFFIAILLAVFCGTLEIGSDLHVEIMFDSWNAVLKFSNYNDYPVHSIKWKNILDTAFLNRRIATAEDVTDPNNPILLNFMGAIPHGPIPKVKDVLVTIDEGATLEINVNFANMFHFEKDKRYQIFINDKIPIFTIHDGEQLVTEFISSQVSSISYLFPFVATKDSEYPGSRESNILSGESTGIRRHTTEGCDEKQISALNLAMENAREDGLQKAIAYLNNYCEYGNADGYRRFFGEVDTTRWNKVLEVYQLAYSSLSSANFRCGGDECETNTNAYVFPWHPSFGHGYNIYVCTRFFTMSTDIAEAQCQPSTIIHEMTHFWTVGGTKDHEYGTPATMKLAKEDPDKAIKNADSYENFVEYGRLPC